MRKGTESTSNAVERSALPRSGKIRRAKKHCERIENTPSAAKGSLAAKEVTPKSLKEPAARYDGSHGCMDQRPFLPESRPHCWEMTFLPSSARGTPKRRMLHARRAVSA